MFSDPCHFSHYRSDSSSSEQSSAKKLSDVFNQVESANETLDPRLGSIVFFREMDYVSHVGILTAIKDGNQYITHGVNGLKLNQVIESAIHNRRIKEYSMFTPTNKAYRLELLHQARQAANQYIKFEDRLPLGLEGEKIGKASPQERLAIHKALHDSNSWRRVKFAARSFLDNGLTNQRGLQCAQFATIMMQNAEKRSEVEKALDLSNTQWISDKHVIDATTENQTDLISGHQQSFDDYQARLRAPRYDLEFAHVDDHRTTDEVNLPKSEHEPDYTIKKRFQEISGKRWSSTHSIWKSPISPQAFFKHTIIPVDSKTVSPETLYLMCKSDPENWGEESIEQAPELSFTDEEKAAWKINQETHLQRVHDKSLLQQQRRESSAKDELDPHKNP